MFRAGGLSSLSTDVLQRDPLVDVWSGAVGDDEVLGALICLAAEAGRRGREKSVVNTAELRAADPRKECLAALERCSLKVGNWESAESSTRSRLADAIRTSMKAGDDGWPLPGRGVVNALAALAPDTIVPDDPRLATAWRVLVGALADAERARVLCLGRQWFLKDAIFTKLMAEADDIRGGRRGPLLRSGRWSERAGNVGRRIAVSVKVMATIGEALGYAVEPGYEAPMLFYERPGDFIQPHVDRGVYGVTMIATIDRRPPVDGSPGSALLAYRPDGSVERVPQEPGEALVVERGRVHAREPLKPGERVTVLSIPFRVKKSTSIG